MATQTTQGRLSLVGTPIGNLSDVSPRVSETLSSADVVLCEDTRVTGKLLSLLGVTATLERCDENVIAQRTAGIVDRIAAGERIAFVSDAGMPGISDPGSRLVDAALDAGLDCEVIPGPSAVTCAVALSGLACEHFFFEGFLPRKTGAQTRRLQMLASVPGALVVYESPRRVSDTLAVMAQVFPGRRVALIRELTKLHEEVVRDEVSALATAIAQREQAEPLRGECVLVVEAPNAAELERRTQPVAQQAAETPEQAVREGLSQGSPKSALAKRVARQFGLDRAEAYDLVVRLSREG